MTQSELSPSSQPVHVWTEGSRKFAIHLHPEVMGRLSAEFFTASKGRPRRDLETGGLLLGHIDSTDDTTTFWVEGFQPIESEHRSGPSHVLSESNFARLLETVTNSGSTSIGLYRRRTRSERLIVNNPDIELFERFFPARDALFLLLGPALGVAAFFARIEGNLKCVHEFAPASSPSGARLRHDPSSSLASQLDPPEEISPGPAALKTGSGLKPGRWLIGALITILVLAAAARMLPYLLRRPSAPARIGESLHLTVERAGPSLRLIWDRDSTTLHGAARVILHLQDGDNRSDRDLSPSEVSAGSFTYEPKTSAVTFRLDVYSEEPAASALVQVNNPPSESKLTQVPPSRPEPPLPIRPLAHKEAVSPDRSEPSADFVRKEEIRPPAAKSPPPIETDSVDTREAKVRIAPENSARPSPLADAPAVPPPAVPPSVRDPAVEVSAETASGSRLERLVEKLPLIRRLRKRAKTTDPVPVYQARPALKGPDKQSLVRPVAVNVKVHVGESGTVESAEVTDYGEPPNFNLANAALTAARLWTFEPARTDETAVSSEVILHFHFNP